MRHYWTMKQLLANFVFMLPISAALGALERGPYIQNITANSVTIKFRTASSVIAEVNILPRSGDPGFQIHSKGSDHELRFTNLTPSTEYTYEILENDSLTVSGDLYHFKTAPLPGTSGEYRIWAIGDSGTANQDARNVYEAYMAETGDEHTDVWLMLGDNAYNNGTEVEFQNAVFNMYTDMLPNTGLWSTRGNHERNGGVYYDIYDLPSMGEGGGIPSGSEAYYSFDYGHVHFVCLDSYDTDRSIGGAMYNWLEADLAATSAEFIIAYFHHPPYTKGSHDSDVWNDSTGRMHEMRERFLPLLEAYGTDLVLSGHSHSYERTYYMAGHYGTSETFDQEHNIVNGGDGHPDGNGEYTTLNGTGTVYITAGNGGKITGTLTRHNAVYAAIYELGGVIMDVSNQVMRVRLLDDQARVLDDFTIRHDVAELPIVENEQVLVSLPNHSHIDLTLADLGGSPTELYLYYGTSDQGKQLDAWDQVQPIATATTTGQYSVTLSGLTDQTMYYYRIYAQNADGGAYSASTGSWMVDQSSAGPPNIEFVGGTTQSAPTTLIPAGAIWSYDDDNEVDTNWTRVTFDDTAWPAGPAQLGYGDGDEATTVAFGNANNKHITTWFRHAMNVAAPGAIAEMTLHLLRDDGAVVYLNGAEVIRTNLPEGDITPDTRALTFIGGSDEDAFTPHPINPALLVPGKNVIAVELHQHGPRSSDISFDLELLVDAYHPSPPAGMTNITYASADGLAELLGTGNLPTTARVMFGTVDGGTQLGLWENSLPLSALLGEQDFALTGLLADTTYFVRLYAENALGSDWSDDTLTFITRLAPPDSDNDGLLDAWEWQYFGDLGTTDGTPDSDSDGLSDAAEYQIGTHPLDPLSALVLDVEASLDGSEHVLHWTNTGILVDIQQCPDLNDPNGWQPLVFDVGHGIYTNGVIPGKRIFYRLIIDQ